MENLQTYVNSINEIFSYLDNLDQNLENEDNSLNIKNLNEYKELAISFAKLIGDNISSNVSNTDDNQSLIPNTNLENEDFDEEGDANDW